MDQNVDSSLFCNPLFHVRPVNLTFLFYVYHLMGIDEAVQSMSVKAVTSIGWQDNCSWEKLASRNPVANETGYYYIEPDKMWRPLINLHSSPDVTPLDYNANKILMGLYNNGRIEYAPLGTWTTSCSLDFRLYPFDKQSCNFIFEVWGPDRMINITFAELRFDSKISQHTFVWQAVDSSTELSNTCFLVPSGETFCPSRVNFTIVAERTGNNQRVDLFITCFSLSLLMALTVTIPVDAPERVSYSVTLLLALAILQFQIKSDIPKTTETIIIVVYINANILAGSIITAYTVLSLGIFMRITEKLQQNSKIDTDLKIRKANSIAKIFRFTDFIVFIFTTVVFFGLVLMLLICFGTRSE